MESIFSETTQEAEVTQATPVKTERDKELERKKKVEEMKKSFKDTLQQQPEFKNILHTLSDSIMVVNTLGYGKNGNIVVDKKASATDEKGRVLKPTSLICGYKLKNVGTEPIQYKTEVFEKDTEGKYVGTVVERTWAPGTEIVLSRVYTTMLCARPEISFTLANGKIVSSSKRTGGNIKDELAAYYFSFTKGEDGATTTVNDDEVKLSVDDGNGVVKPEFVETFGYLNNPKETRAGRGKSTKYSTQDVAANYINKLLEQQGM